MTMLPASKRPVVLRNPDPFEEDVLAAIRQHAIDEFPRECVGFVLPSGYVRVNNVSDDPENKFSISPEETAMALDAGALALVHSHPDAEPSPSVHDQQAQIETGMTWGIVPVMGINVGDDINPVPGQITWWGDDLPIQPLERRRFIWGVFHCWSLYRDWMRLEYGLTLPNFAVGREFIENKENVFIDNCERAGLRNMGKLSMDDLQVGDMLLGHIKGEFPNHCGVYLGGDDFLHHPPGGASGKTNLLKWWPHIDTVFRHDGIAGTAPIR